MKGVGGSHIAPPPTPQGKLPSKSPALLVLKSGKAELKQQVKVSLAKYAGMFPHDCNYN